MSVTGDRPQQPEGTQQHQDRHRHEQDEVGHAEPAFGDRRMRQRRPQADDPGDQQHRPDQWRPQVVHALLQVAGGLHDQPRAAQQGIGDDQRQPAEHRERRQPVQRPTSICPVGDRKAVDERPQCNALEESRHQRTTDEGLVPDVLARLAGLEAELEGHAAEYQPHQHEDDRQVQRRQHHRIGQRERREQPRPTEHQPGLVAVPDRCHGVHRHIAVGLVADEREKNADTQVEPVHDHVHHDAEDDDHGPDQRKIDTHAQFPSPSWSPCSCAIASSAAEMGRAGVRF